MIEYPRRTIVMGLFYSEESKTKLIGYANAEYLSDPHKALSQARYVFCMWRHNNILANNEANVAMRK